MHQHPAGGDERDPVPRRRLLRRLDAAPIVGDEATLDGQGQAIPEDRLLAGEPKGVRPPDVDGEQPLVSLGHVVEPQREASLADPTPAQGDEPAQSTIAAPIEGEEDQGGRLGGAEGRRTGSARPLGDGPRIGGGRVDGLGPCGARRGVRRSSGRRRTGGPADGELQLGPGDDLDAVLEPGPIGLDHAVQAVAVRDGDPVVCPESERMLSMGARGDEDFSRYLHGGQWAPPEVEEDADPNDIEHFLLPFGQANVVKPGDDCTIVAMGRTVHFALEAAEALEDEEIDAEVIDIRTVRPLDIDTILQSVRKTNYCVVVDDSWPFASVSSEIAAQIYEKAFDHLDNTVHRVTADDVPPPYAKHLEQEFLPNSRKIIEAAKSATYNT